MSRLIKTILLCGLIASSDYPVKAQELFVYTEPASNMPAHSVGLRLSNWLMKDRAEDVINYHFLPELMWGVNKNLMIHAEGFISNRGKALDIEGGGLYAKYRFYSKDDVHKHFRMALFGRLSSNNADIHMEEIEINGHNSGYEIGIIGTQLLHRQAISASVSFEQAINNAKGNEIPKMQASRAINYSLSTGRLIFPNDYSHYGQTNFNIMVELLGQYQPENGKSYIDIAPAIQFIFNSQARLDIGYKKQLYSNMSRTASDGFLIRLEYLLFSVL